MEMHVIGSWHGIDTDEWSRQETKSQMAVDIQSHLEEKKRPGNHRLQAVYMIALDDIQIEK